MWSSSAIFLFSALRAGVVLSFSVTIARCFTPTRQHFVKSRSTFMSTSISSMSSNIFDVDRRTAASLVGSAWGFVFSNVANASGDSETKNIPPRLQIPTWTISPGVEFPILALNTAGLSANESYEAMSIAKQEGITHIDFHPGIERDGVARYLAENNNRDDFFLNTKLRKAPPGTSPRDAAQMAAIQIEEDLKVLGVSYVDMLMLRDSPVPEVMQQQWKVLEEALSKGQTRSIGVVNYCQSALKSVTKTAKVFPAVNYIMVHVGMGSDVHGLRSFGEGLGIRTFSYGQIGEPNPSPDILQNPVLKSIGRANAGRTAEEVALKWVLQNGIAASVRPSNNFGQCMDNTCIMGIKRHARVFEWQLTEKDMITLDNLKAPDDNPTLFSSPGCPGAYSFTMMTSLNNEPKS